MNNKKRISFYGVRNSFSNVFSRNKNIIFLAIIVVIIAIFFAIATIIKNKEQIDIFNCLDKNIICFISGDIDWFRLFLMYALFDIISFLIIIFCSNSKLLFIVNYVLLFFYSFCCAFNSSLFVYLYGIKGLIFSLCSFVLLSIIKLFLFLWLIGLTKDCVCYKNNQHFWQNCLIIAIIAIVVDFVWTLVFKCIFPFFIIIV